MGIVSRGLVEVRKFLRMLDDRETDVVPGKALRVFGEPLSRRMLVQISTHVQPDEGYPAVLAGLDDARDVLFESEDALIVHGMAPDDGVASSPVHRQCALMPEDVFFLLLLAFDDFLVRKRDGAVADGRDPQAQDVAVAGRERREIEEVGPVDEAQMAAEELRVHVGLLADTI